jgi:diguanylate cyclase (GGDEF)-like protein/PAS domain S-box-containing protein
VAVDEPPAETGSLFGERRGPDPLVVVQRLLAKHPGARLTATTPTGLPMDVPSELIGPSARVRDESINSIVLADRSAVIVAFASARTNGAAVVDARFFDDPNTFMTLYLVDVRPTYDAVIAVIVAQPERPVPTRGPANEPEDGTPRLARITKSDIAVILTIDEATTKILGWTEEEMVGRTSLDFVHPDDQVLAMESWFDGLAEPGRSRRVRLRHRARSGEWIWFEITNNNLLDSDEHYVLAEMVDISKEMAAQELLGRLAQALPLGVFQIDANRRFVYRNQRLLDLLGVTRMHFVDDLLALAVPGTAGALHAAFDATLTRSQEQDIEVELQSLDRGESGHFQLNLRPLSDQPGSPSGAIGCLADVTESVLLRRALEYRATYDTLTGCRNRPSITAALHDLVATPGDPGAGIGVFFVDLDGFKSVNDTFGHAAGDELLSIVADRLRASLREDDLLGRLGGDEFIVICPHLPTTDAALDLGYRINERLSGDVKLIAGVVPLSASIGVAWTPFGQLDEDILINRADLAMYNAKRDAVGQVYLYQPPPLVTAPQ